MKVLTPRLRMIAGPNGSGKSTIKTLLHPHLLGVFINPDEIEKEIRQQGYINLKPYQVATSAPEIIAYFSASVLLKEANLLHEVPNLRFDNDKLSFASVPINSYFASVIADFLRRKLLASRISFSFETVMSSIDKVELLAKAQQQGFRTYLYYVATNDSTINIRRIEERVRNGGHPVPNNKVKERYCRSLNLLSEAIRYTNRAFIFDNSNETSVWMAEIIDGYAITMKTAEVEEWFNKFVLSKKQETDES